MNSLSMKLLVWIPENPNPAATIPPTTPTQPENFLLSDKTPNATLKATDFGLSAFFMVRVGLGGFGRRGFGVESMRAQPRCFGTVK